MFRNKTRKPKTFPPHNHMLFRSDSFPSTWIAAFIIGSRNHSTVSSFPLICTSNNLLWINVSWSERAGFHLYALYKLQAILNRLCNTHTPPALLMEWNLALFWCYELILMSLISVRGYQVNIHPKTKKMLLSHSVVQNQHFWG